MQKLKAEDYIGKQYEYLKVTGITRKKNRAYFVCDCKCGNTCEILAYNVKGGNSLSCGCRQIESASTHRESKTRLYVIWIGIHSRCEKSNDTGYAHYGERGIAVCEEWARYEPFRDWALNSGYNDNLTIDRIDVNGNYEPSNCRWATMTVQNRNQGMHSTNTSGVKGVSRIGNRWRAYITVEDKYIHIGRYDTIEQAAEARRQAEIKYWGENA